jgi:uncharacterized protein YndB with AHSA1/START domain
MAPIKHRVGIKSSVQDLWEAITNPAKISNWWSSFASGSAQTGSNLHLTFDGLVTLSFTVIDCVKDRLLHLQNTGGPGAWDTSHLVFELSEDVEQTFLVLKHYNPDSSEDDFQFFMTKWPIFLVSLKSYLETGEGRPYPHDIKIQAGL